MSQETYDALYRVAAFAVLAAFLIAMAVWWRQSSTERRLRRLHRSLTEGRFEEVLAAPVPSDEAASPTLLLQAQPALAAQAPDRARQLAVAAAAAAEANGSAGHRTPLAYRIHCRAAYELGDHADLRYLLGDDPSAPWARWMRTDVALATGEDAVAERLLDPDTWPAEAEARRLVTLARLRFGQLRLAEAQELLDQVLTLVASSEHAEDRRPWQSLAMVLGSQVALADGRHEAARAAARAVLTDLAQPSPELPEASGPSGPSADDAIRLSAATVLAATGSPDEAEAQLARTSAPAYPSTRVDVLRLWAEAEIAAARGDLPQARHLLSEAIERAGAAGLMPRADQLTRRLDALSPTDM